MKKSKIDVANYFMLIIVVNVLLHYFVPIKQLLFFPYRYIGIVLFVLGWVPNFWYGIYFRKIKTSIPSKEEPKKFVTTGLFRISRNPIYLGMILALFGEAVFLGSLITFILPILFFILINILNVPFEEDTMEKRFGKKYLDYKKKVRRWV